MDLKQLEYFVRVAELGSFTRAAHALDVAQPALSRQVRLLEVELRQNLLVRNGRGATPTEAGKLLLDHRRGILHQIARAREELGRVRGGLAGRVAIGLPPSLARALAVPLTKAFRHNLPEASLSISEGLSAALQEGLLNGRLDLAVLYNPTPQTGIDIVPPGEEELVAEGMGSALLSHNAVSSSIRPSAYRVRAVCDPPLRTRLAVATSSQRPTTLTQQATLDLIQQLCQGLLSPTNPA